MADLTSDSIDLSKITEKEFKDIQAVFEDFREMTIKYKSFYTTVFLNNKNRKLTFNFSNGKCIKATVNKLYEEEDETNEQ